jgi:hypothetical protein
MSFHLPEKGAIRGVDHRPPSKDEVIIVEDERLPRVKKSVFPFAEKVGERSSAGPEMIPGANSFGLFALCAAHSGEFAPKRARSPTRQFMYIRVFDSHSAHRLFLNGLPPNKTLRYRQ